MEKRNIKLLKATGIAFAVVMFWRGIWGIADVYLFPNNYALSSWVSLVIGLLSLIIGRRMIKNFLY